MSITLTIEQRQLARHALGLPNERRRSYRNHYVVDAGADHAEWIAMVEAGAARRWKGNALTGDMDLFRLTRAGAAAALELGETLHPEDFPA